MVGQAKGKGFGRELVRAMAEPLDGKILTGKVESDGDNQYKNMAGGTSTLIKGVAVKADASNSGAIYIIELDKDGNPGIADEGFDLAAGESVSLATDDLSKVNVFIPTLGDKVRYCAIAAARSIEP